MVVNHRRRTAAARGVVVSGVKFIPVVNIFVCISIGKNRFRVRLS